MAIGIVLTQVKINSVDVTSRVINYDIERAFGDSIAEVSLRVDKTVSDLVSLQVAQTVEIFRGFTLATDTKIFDGRMESFTPEGGMLKIVGKDKIWDLVKKEVTKVYDSTIDASAGKISEIFKDLVTVQGGLTADSGTIQDSGTVFIIKKFICNHTNIFERCKELASALDWQFYYRPDTDKVYFEPKGFTANSNILNVGAEVSAIPKWFYDSTEMVNDLTVTGATSEVETTESGQIGVTSGYTTTSVLLTAEPTSVKVFADTVNPPTTLRQGGIEGSSPATFYYSVDVENKKILPRTTTTFTTNDFFEVRYSKKVPVNVRLFVQSSIDTFTSFRKTINFQDIRTIADAEARGTNYLFRYSNPFTYSTLKVVPDSVFNFIVGQLVSVVDNVSTPTVNSQFVINRHVLKYPGNYDELYIGDREWRLAEWSGIIEERLKRFEEAFLANITLALEQVNVAIDPTNTVNLVARYRKITTQTLVAGSRFILGSATDGILGTSQLGSGSLGVAINAYIQQYLDVLEEFFVDTDFKDTGATTASWTTDGTLDFTSGQVAKSTAVDFANGTITQAKMTATISSGTFLLEMSANGGTNFETVTSGILYTFTNTGTDLRWRITENAVSTGTITKVKIESYH